MPSGSASCAKRPETTLWKISIAHGTFTVAGPGSQVVGKRGSVNRIWEVASSLQSSVALPDRPETVVFALLTSLDVAKARAQLGGTRATLQLTF